MTDLFERRRHRRLRVKGNIEVNGGYPFDGGLLFDLSATGLAVTYPSGGPMAGAPLSEGQEVLLKLDNLTQNLAEIVRVDPRGFAARFV